jgi:hypothetical protein
MFPNHWCAISCATTNATENFDWIECFFWSISNSGSLNVNRPKFSIAFYTLTVLKNESLSWACFEKIFTSWEIKTCHKITIDTSFRKLQLKLIFYLFLRLSKQLDPTSAADIRFRNTFHKTARTWLLSVKKIFNFNNNFDFCKLSGYI